MTLVALDDVASASATSGPQLPDGDLASDQIQQILTACHPFSVLTITRRMDEAVRAVDMKRCVMSRLSL